MKTDTYLVAVKSLRLQKKIEELGCEVVNVLKNIKVLVVKCPSDSTVEAIRGLDGVISVNPNQVKRAI